MVEHITGASFVEAVEFITCETTAKAGEGEDVENPRDAPKGEAEAMRNAFVATRIETIVRELVPVRDSLGEHYFQEARAIDTDLIADILKRAAAIGWHPSILFREDSHSLDGERLGCVVGVMTDPVSAKLMGATSRIYLHGGSRSAKSRRPVCRWGSSGCQSAHKTDPRGLGGMPTISDNRNLANASGVYLANPPK